MDLQTGTIQVDKNNRVVFLDWLRVIACLMVMVVHSSECMYSNDYSFSFPSELGRWSVCLINGFVRPAVPLFLIASAYLLIPLHKLSPFLLELDFLAAKLTINYYS